MNLHADLQRLLGPPKEARCGAGYGHTLDEILSQPRLWRRTAEIVESRRTEIRDRLDEWGVGPGSARRVILAGAGSSAHAAMCAEPTLRIALGSGVEAIATTDIITTSGGLVGPSEPYVLVSIARSGASPESLAVLRGVGLQPGQRIGNVIITCNPRGELALGAAPEDLLLIMPEGSDDQGLAMTASFSCLTLAALLLAHLGDSLSLVHVAEEPAECVERFLYDEVAAVIDLAGRPFERAVFLGSGPLKATARECALKLMELTAGRVVCLWDSYLGLRHGPQTMVDERCLVVALVDDAAGSMSYPYELDLLRELRQKGQGAEVLAVGNELPAEVSDVTDGAVSWRPGNGAIPLALRPLSDVVIGQILGLLKSMELGLRPDNPSPSGVIHRVVQGVRIYDPERLSRGEVRAWMSQPASE